MPPHSSTLAWKIPWTEEPGRLQSMGSLSQRLSDFTFTFHFHTLEKEMATHSSVLAWRIPGKVEPDGLSSLGSHRVGHDWSDLAAAADNWNYRVSLSKTHIAYTTVNFMRLLLTPTSKIIPTQRFWALTQTPRPQTKKQTSFSIRSVKLLPNTGPKFCPPHKTSLPSYSKKLR